MSARHETATTFLGRGEATPNTRPAGQPNPADDHLSTAA
jgi:hypothetical protein